MELKIEYLPLEALTPYERNARKHEAADVQTIKNSIKEFGMSDPIGIWGDKNIIVEGHGRLLALKELGHTQAPCIRLDHLTDEQRRAYALAHNKTAEMSAWDFDKVESEIAALEMDMSQFGFENKDDSKGTTERDDLSEKVAEVYEVIVECADEFEQEEVFNRLQEEGLQCRVLTL